MFNHKETDIIVLGAGAVGLIAAHALERRKANYVLLDQKQPKNFYSYALALHPQTLEVLDSLDLAEPVLENALKLQKVSIYEKDTEKAMLDYSTLPLKYPFLAVIGQSEFEKILVDQLVRKHRKPLWNHRVRFIEDDGSKVKVSVDRLIERSTGYAVSHLENEIDKSFDYMAKYLIGADGHNSTARRCAGIDFSEFRQSADYAIFEFTTKADLPMEMRVIVQDDKTHIYWPLSGERCRWSFQIESDSVPAHLLERNHQLTSLETRQIPALSKEHLYELLSENAPWFQGTIQSVNWRMVIRFEHRLAESFGKSRIWLAGDAAHITPPAGILSMNVGIREAVDLVDRLDSAKTDAEQQKSLEKYNQHYRDEWQYLLDLDHHISAADKSAHWLLNHHDSFVCNIPATGETLTELLAQVHLFDAD